MHFTFFVCLLVVAYGVNLEWPPPAPPKMAAGVSGAVSIMTGAVKLMQDEYARFMQGPVIAQLTQQMQAAPINSSMQLQSCQKLFAIANTQREGPGPFGGKRVSTALLKVGIGGAFAQGLSNSVAIDVAEGRKTPSTATEACFVGINSLTVQNDYDKGLALINNAPLLWQAIVSYFQAFKGSQQVKDYFCTFAGLFGTPQPAQAAAAEVAAGGIDFVMEYFKDESISSDPELFQKVFCALSDPVHEKSGVVARAMANHGGPLHGIPLMVNALKMAKKSQSTFHEANGFGLLYEGVHIIGGVMEHDETKSFANAFVQAGLTHEIMPIMKKEPDDHLLQDMSCEVIKWITDDKVANAIEIRKQLAYQGALEVITKTLEKFTHPPIHGYAMVAGTCAAALLNFALPHDDYKDWLLYYGVDDMLDDEVMQSFPIGGNDEFEPRAKAFPNTNIYRLKEVLSQRKAILIAARSR